LENRIEIIHSFYQAFKDLDPELMVSHYDENIEFTDPAFGTIKGVDACNMWRMLIGRAHKTLRIEYSDVRSDGDKVTAHLEAFYPFSKTGRSVHNIIEAEFEFREDKIVKHSDSFDFWRWSSMALGLPGILLGWSPLLKNKVRKQCLSYLVDYSKKSK